MTKTLGGTHVAVIVAAGLDREHLVDTLVCLRAAGAHAFVVGTLDGPVPTGTAESRESEALAFDDVDPARFDAVVVPEQTGPHALRQDTGAVRFIRAMAQQHKPVATIGNGAGILIDAGIVKDRRVACGPELGDELSRAGGTVSDDDVDLDGPLVTASGRDQLQPLCKAVIHALERRVAAGVRADPAPP